jgi:hypothetical protein
MFFLQRGAGKQLQDFGEELSAKVQETAENVRDSLQGAQSDASSKASSAARTGQSKLEQGADDAEGLGAKIGNQAENLKVYMCTCTNQTCYHTFTMSFHFVNPIVHTVTHALELSLCITLCQLLLWCLCILGVICFQFYEHLYNNIERNSTSTHAYRMSVRSSKIMRLNSCIRHLNRPRLLDFLPNQPVGDFFSNLRTSVEFYEMNSLRNDGN